MKLRICTITYHKVLLPWKEKNGGKNEYKENKDKKMENESETFMNLVTHYIASTKLQGDKRMWGEGALVSGHTWPWSETRAKPISLFAIQIDPAFCCSICWCMRLLFPVFVFKTEFNGNSRGWRICGDFVFSIRFHFTKMNLISCFMTIFGD